MLSVRCCAYDCMRARGRGGSEEGLKARRERRGRERGRGRSEVGQGMRVIPRDGEGPMAQARVIHITGMVVLLHSELLG